MPEMTSAYDWRGRTLIDRSGEKIGKLDELYVDEVTDKPEWARVNTGLFGSNSSFVPLAGATAIGEDVQVQVDNEQVKSAPNIAPDAELSQEEERQLFEHYGVPYTEEGSVTATTGTATGTTKGRTTDDAMTRSEEELRVCKAQRERGRARLRKYVVTEQVQQTVPVQREEARVEREPVTEANIDRATSGPDISEEEHEVVLHEEEPVVEKRTVPKERVRMTKDTVTDEEQVSEELRTEQIEAEGERPSGAA